VPLFIDQILRWVVIVAEVFISLTLSTMVVIVQLMKYLVSPLCDGRQVFIVESY
jgi:hypothetical protein